MAEKSLGLGKTIVASLVAGFILWIVPVIWPASEVAQWLVRGVHAVQTSIATAFDFVVRVATYPLPAWCLLVALIGLTILLRLRRLPRKPALLVLTDKAKHALQILAVADGERVPIEVLAQMLDVRKLEMEMIFERLWDAGLIGEPGSYYTPGRTLSRKGRDYAFESGLVGDRDLAARLRNARHGVGGYLPP